MKNQKLKACKIAKVVHKSILPKNRGSGTKKFVDPALDDQLEKDSFSCYQHEKESFSCWFVKFLTHSQHEKETSTKRIPFRAGTLLFVVVWQNSDRGAARKEFTSSTKNMLNQHEKDS